MGKMFLVEDTRREELVNWLRENLTEPPVHPHIFRFKWFPMYSLNNRPATKIVIYDDQDAMLFKLIWNPTIYD